MASCLKSKRIAHGQNSSGGNGMNISHEVATSKGACLSASGAREFDPLPLPPISIRGTVNRTCTFMEWHFI